MISHLDIFMHSCPYRYLMLIRRKFLALFTLIACVSGVASQSPGAIRVAIVSDSQETEPNSISMAEAELSGENSIQMLDRAEINQILKEQAFSLTGVVDADHAVAAGKLLTAQVLAVVETNTVKESGAGDSAVGLVVFDAATGLRLWDQALSGGDEAIAGEITRGVQASIQKRQQTSSSHTICLVTTRNADLPRSASGFCDAVGQLFLRDVTGSQAVAVLERAQLGKVTTERKLGGEPSPDAMLGSIVPVDIDISRGDQSGALSPVTATARLSTVKRDVISKVTVQGTIGKPGDLAKDLSDRVLLAMQLPASAALAPDLASEARRFYLEALHAQSHLDWTLAASASEAAQAIAPQPPIYQILATKARILEALSVERGPVNEDDFYFPGAFSSKFSPCLRMLRPAADELCDAGQLPGAVDELTLPVKAMHEFIVMAMRQLPSNPYKSDWSGMTLQLNDQDQEDLSTITDDYSRYAGEIEEPARFQAVKDAPSFLAYRETVKRILGDSYFIRAKTSNDYTANVARLMPRWAAAAHGIDAHLRYDDIDQIVGYVFSSNWGAGRNLQTSWENDRWTSRWKWDAVDIQNFETALQGMEQSEPGKFPGVHLFIDGLKGIPRTTRPAMIVQGSSSQHKPVAPGPITLPWNTEQALIDLKGPDSDLTSVWWPSVRDGFVYVPVIGGEIKLLKISLADARKDVLSTLPIDTAAPVNDLYNTCLMDDFLTAESGSSSLCILALHGGTSRIISENDVLPSGHVQAAANLGDIVYLAMGWEHDAVLVAYDTKSNKFVTLASSRRNEILSPFDNTDPMVVEYMVADPDRQRILFFAHNTNWDPAKKGLWEYSQKTSQFRQIKTVPIDDHGPGKISVKGTFVTGNQISVAIGGIIRLNIDLATDQPPQGPTRRITFMSRDYETRPQLADQWNRQYGNPTAGFSSGDNTFAQRLALSSVPVLQNKSFISCNILREGDNPYQIIVGEHTAGLWLLTVNHSGTTRPSPARSN